MNEKYFLLIPSTTGWQKRRADNPVHWIYPTLRQAALHFERLVEVYRDVWIILAAVREGSEAQNSGWPFELDSIRLLACVHPRWGLIRMDSSVRQALD